ncbi:pyrroloquinoline quinone biosynthesis protein B [Oceanobacillus limi]|uniref:Pyrroloquinoline quinone biosynthesis protein B n=1 Tax=Oceanobacillus limi TaxID=930131 RepID=A0A1I0FL57_9BACI|nr:MBL fold metallo-hydrolase [Oceanobacillus limi]SET57988.1 pyrroloquinoline quinone biosynthesis protein B [Oceanobacillus limi]
MSEVVLHLLGTAQDGGVPHPNCSCENCQTAISDPVYKRNAASMAIVFPDIRKWHLIDATPDIKDQLLNVQRKHNLHGVMMDSIFLTHAHMGHYPGLLFLGREGINTTKIPVYTGKKMKQLLEEHAPWSQLSKLENIKVLEVSSEDSISLSKLVSITPVEVPHRNEFTETFGYWIKGPTYKVLYIPDIDRWEEWNVDIYDACQDADIIILDGTFHSEKDLNHISRNFHEIPHPLMTDTMDKLSGLVDKKRIYFTHMNHSNPALSMDKIVAGEIEARGFRLADDGMEFKL